jgi:putative transposase
MNETTPSPLGNVITIDDERIKNHLDRVVRGSVEETLNALLDAEANRLCNAQRYERTEARRDTRAGHYERKLQTKAGEVKLRIPKLRMQTFETAIIERYRRRESSVEEALIEMYLAGVSVRRVEDITRPCGVHEYRRRRCQTSTRRSTARSRRGAIGRLKASIPTLTWTA